MKLYSRGQLALAAVFGLAAALLVGLGIGWVVLDKMPSSAMAVSPSVPGGTGAALVQPAATGTDGMTAVRTVDLAPEFSAGETENITVYERLNEAVVNITTEVMAINWFMEPVPQDGGSGSGSIITEDGYILTNNHVVKDAYKLFVSLADGSRYEAKVVGTDPESDLAVIKIEPPKGLHLPTVPYGDSTRLKVGQKVLAIGNPFGLERTLSEGIVSGLGRPVQNDDGRIMRDMIQTDAAINPGNSGGPLLNARGELIGINTMIVSPSGGSVGIGFAVPVATAKRIVPELIKNGMVKRGWIEFEAVQLFPALVDYLQKNGYKPGVDQGLLVSVAKKGGGADRAGIRGGATPVTYGRSGFNVGGDIVVAIAGMKVTSIADLYSALENTRPGDRILVEYMRGGKRTGVEVVLADRASYVKPATR